MLGFVSVLYSGRRVLRTIMRGFLLLVREIDCGIEVVTYGYGLSDLGRPF